MHCSVWTQMKEFSMADPKIAHQLLGSFAAPHSKSDFETGMRSENAVAIEYGPMKPSSGPDLGSP